MRALRNREQKHAISCVSTEREAVTLTSGSSTYLNTHVQPQAGHSRATRQLKMEDKETAMSVDEPSIKNDAVFKYLLVLSLPSPHLSP